MENKKTLADEFSALNPEQRRSVHFSLCEHALEKWNLYAQAHGQIKYIESTAGTRQVVDQELPFDALTAARRGFDAGNVANRYEEPITALEEDDLAFPEAITFAYYAIYNLFNKYVQKDVIDDWLIVNQALSAEDDDALWDALLKNAIPIH
jgi:hypothetical protein